VKVQKLVGKSKAYNSFMKLFGNTAQCMYNKSFFLLSFRPFRFDDTNLHAVSGVSRGRERFHFLGTPGECIQNSQSQKGNPTANFAEPNGRP
jgi:hypothetical protein